MGNFSDQLATIMKTRKIAVDDIILSLNISRAAFFKYKNGSRIPAKIESVEKIADALRLNRSERESLLEAYKIDRIGENKYRGFQAIEKFLTTPIDEYRARSFDITIPALEKKSNMLVIHGQMNVVMHIYSTVNLGLDCGDVTMLETICAGNIFTILQQLRKKNNNYKIEHIMAMNSSEDTYVRDRLYDVENLGNLIITMCRCENYYPFYYYASLSTLRTLEDFMDNIVVTENCVFCYSGNMDHGVLYRDERICSLYKEIVTKWRKRAKPFAEKIDMAAMLRAYDVFGEKDMRYSFMPGICMTSVYETGDKLLETNIHLDEVGIDSFLQAFPTYVDNFCKRLNTKKGLYNYVVPGNALRYNLRTGFSQELPKKITIPLSREKMKVMLQRFQRACDLYDFRVIDDERFPEDNTIEIESAMTEAMITLSLPGEATTRIFLVKESGVSALIFEYLRHLYEDKGLRGAERSQWFEELLRD